MAAPAIAALASSLGPELAKQFSGGGMKSMLAGGIRQGGQNAIARAVQGGIVGRGDQALTQHLAGGLPKSSGPRGVGGPSIGIESFRSIGALQTRIAQNAAKRVAIDPMMNAISDGSRVAGAFHDDPIKGRVAGELGSEVARLGSLAANAATLNPRDVAAFGKELVMAIPKMEKWGDALVQSQERLKTLNGDIAQTFAERQVRTLGRDILSGQRTGESTLQLNREIQDLKDNLQPLRDGITNISNNLLTEIITLINKGIELLEDNKSDITKGVRFLNMIATGPMALWVEEGAKAVMDMAEGDADANSAELDVLRSMLGNERFEPGFARAPREPFTIDPSRDMRDKIRPTGSAG